MGTTTVNITAAQVKELRDKTNAPMMDCKNALTEAKGDIEAAIVVLRKKGVATAAKKATRATSEGSVASYIHAGGKIGVLVEVNCESDFVARTDDFKTLVHDIAMHIAATDPTLHPQGRRDAGGLREREGHLPRTGGCDRQAGAVVEKIVEGKMGKFYEEVCLLEQPFIKDQTITVSSVDRDRDWQVGREHLGQALCPLQGGRRERDESRSARPAKRTASKKRN